MRYERIDVIPYSGRKGEERPMTVVLRGLRIDVVSIVDQWIEEGSADRVQKRCFRIAGSDGNIHLVLYDERNQEWYYAS